MFKLFQFGRSNKALLNTKATADPFLQVLHPSQLLLKETTTITQLKSLVGLSDQAFNYFYKPVLTNLTRLFQQLTLPCNPKLLLTHALEMGLLALKLRQAYLLSSEAGAEAIARNQDLWTYAVFLSAVLEPIPATLFKLHIEFEHPKTLQITPWNPVNGFLDELAERYFQKALKPEPLHTACGVLLLPKIIPPEGLAWLSSNPSVFNAWIALMAGMPGISNPLAEIIETVKQPGKAKPETNVVKNVEPSISKAPVSQQQAQTHIPGPSSYESLEAEAPLEDVFEVLDNPFIVNNKTPVKPDVNQKVALKKIRPALNPELEAFLQWLQEGIIHRSVSINEPGAPIQVVTEGVLLATPAIFQQYAKARDLEDWLPLQRMLLKQNWHVKNKGINIINYQVSGQHKVSSVNGILIKDTQLIFGDVKIPRPNPHLQPGDA